MDVSAPKRSFAAIFIAVLALFGSVAPLHAQTAGRTIEVNSPEQYRRESQNLRPGDTIVLADGVWRDFEILFEGRGRDGAPITLTAQTPGRVIISGASNLRIAGEHMVVRGLVFRDGHSPSGEVIAFRRDSRRLAFNSRVTEIVIDSFNKPERADNEIWVALFGRNNRIDHSHLEGKLTAGPTMAVRLDAIESNANHHRIDHNYFGPRPPYGSNGGETLRIGTSHNSLEQSNTVVEYNMFEECDGEIEIISNKSGGNVFRGNLFLRSQGALTLRHGSGNLVENNVFFGDGVANTGGVRVINADQTVRNNAFVSLRGENFASALTMMNAVPNSPLNRYHHVRNARIENNTFIDVAAVDFGAGADEERSLAPAESTFRNNLFVGETRFRVRSDMSGVAFANNIIMGGAAPTELGGFEHRALTPLIPGEAGQLPSVDAPAGVGSERGLRLLGHDEVGAAWYPKPARTRLQRESRVIEVAPGTDTLSAAIESAAAGDVLQLAPGRYLQRRSIDVTVPLTVRGAAAARAVISFESSTLFSLSGRGSLTLQRLRFEGGAAPDAAANSVVRARGAQPPHNYTLTIADCEFAGLSVNRGFAVLRADAHSFADRIRIERSSFEDVSGPVLSLHGEAEALGVYNAELIEVSDSRFVRVSGPAFDIYRGGRDESTFGPRLILRNNVFDDVARTGQAALLHGVQVVDLSGNTFTRSGRFRWVIEVGTPRLIIDGAPTALDAAGAVFQIEDQRP
jgi:poly(beta-D-mannuronate) lyase